MACSDVVVGFEAQKWLLGTSHYLSPGGEGGKGWGGWRTLSVTTWFSRVMEGGSIMTRRVLRGDQKYYREGSGKIYRGTTLKPPSPTPNRNPNDKY